jgi:ComF family protein
MSYLFDNRCLICEKSSNKNICQSCIDSFLYFPKENYLKYSNDFYFNNLYSLLNFDENLKKIIHIYKFDNYRKLSIFFANLFIERFGKNFFNSYDYITATPLHKDKFKKRGFNQTTLILEKIVEVDKIFLGIERVRKTKQQSLLFSIEDRVNNLENSFQFKNSCQEKVAGKKILIFDDIFTTGTTLNSLAKEFYFAKAKEIDIITLGVA